jgi:CBS domain-containing protein
MKVEDVMNRAPRTLGADQMLNDAAQLMWDHDHGWIPIVDERHRIIGVITDRDVCMAAYTRGRRLEEIAVAGTMVTKVFSCKPSDSVAEALAAMRAYRVRRLPVVNDEGVLVGLVSLSDLARDAAAGGDLADVGATLASICEPRGRAE